MCPGVSEPMVSLNQLKSRSDIKDVNSEDCDSVIGVASLVSSLSAN